MVIVIVAVLVVVVDVVVVVNDVPVVDGAIVPLFDVCCCFL